jgi:DNA-binding FrmR family transcriptional regulator
MRDNRSFGLDAKEQEEGMEEHIVTHKHVLEDGTVIEHTHVEEAKHEGEQMHGHVHSHGEHEAHEGHTHSHTHTHQNTKAVLNRLSRAIGHLESIRRMVEDGRDCSEVLVQLSAVKSAINNTGKVILRDHIEHCIVDAVREGDVQALEELNDAIDRFMK